MYLRILNMVPQVYHTRAAYLSAIPFMSQGAHKRAAKIWTCDTVLSAHCSSVHLWRLRRVPSRWTSGQRAHVLNAVLSQPSRPRTTPDRYLASQERGWCRLTRTSALPPSRAFPPTPLQLQAGHVRAHAGLPRALPCGRPLRQPPNPPKPPIEPRAAAAAEELQVGHHGGRRQRQPPWRSARRSAKEMWKKKS